MSTRSEAFLWGESVMAARRWGVEWNERPAQFGKLCRFVQVAPSNSHALITKSGQGTHSVKSASSRLLERRPLRVRFLNEVPDAGFDIVHGLRIEGDNLCTG